LDQFFIHRHIPILPVPAYLLVGNQFSLNLGNTKLGLLPNISTPVSVSPAILNSPAPSSLLAPPVSRPSPLSTGTGLEWINASAVAHQYLYAGAGLNLVGNQFSLNLGSTNIWTAPQYSLPVLVSLVILLSPTIFLLEALFPTVLSKSVLPI
jgi:hypothetical protein